MKKLIAMLLALVLVMGLVACGNTTTPETTGAAPETTGATEGTEDFEGADATDAPTENETTEETAAPEAPEANEATTVLTEIWNAVPQDQRAPVMGGDMNSMVSDMPGNYSLTDEGLNTVLYVPADQVANLTSASSLMHMMLQNNFTCGLFQLAEGADAAAFAEAMKASIGSAQWMCGMPEKMLIASIDGGYVLACYGLNDAVQPLETAITTVYADAEIIVNEAITG